jgi:nuclear pore complex protein Nup53
MAAVPPPMQSLSPMVSAAERDEGMQYEQPQYGDVWVTAFGFSQQDTPLILGELSKCGDILQWGMFGQANANYIHVQFQNKYAAQRALLRNGEQFSPSLIVGIKPTNMHHRMAIEQYQAGGGEVGQPMALSRPTAMPERSYRIEAQPQVTLPQPRSTMSKVFEYVLGF